MAGATLANVFGCTVDGCERSFPTARSLYLHTQNEHTYAERGEAQPKPRYLRNKTQQSATGTPPAEYANGRTRATRPSFTDAVLGVKFSQATQDGRCPKCGSVAFKAKRSFGGKVALGLLAPKTQVRCEGCGTTYRRG